jgi:hypothetical protein
MERAKATALALIYDGRERELFDYSLKRQFPYQTIPSFTGDNPNLLINNRLFSQKNTHPSSEDYAGCQLYLTAHSLMMTDPQ